MPLSNHQIESGYEILVSVLEEALEAHVDSIRLEYEDTGLGVNFFSGELGSLVGIVPRDQEQEVLAASLKKRVWRRSSMVRSVSDFTDMSK